MQDSSTKRTNVRKKGKGGREQEREEGEEREVTSGIDGGRAFRCIELRAREHLSLVCIADWLVGLFSEFFVYSVWYGRKSHSRHSLHQIKF